jgi:hypothetical protein
MQVEHFELNLSSGYLAKIVEQAQIKSFIITCFFIHINLYLFNSLDHHQILALTTLALVSLSGRIGTVAPFSFCSLVFG